jgi:hypothetical protein
MEHEEACLACRLCVLVACGCPGRKAHVRHTYPHAQTDTTQLTLAPQDYIDKGRRALCWCVGSVGAADLAANGVGVLRCLVPVFEAARVLSLFMLRV